MFVFFSKVEMLESSRVSTKFQKFCDFLKICLYIWGFYLIPLQILTLRSALKGSKNSEIELL